MQGKDVSGNKASKALKVDRTFKVLRCKMKQLLIFVNKKDEGGFLIHRGFDLLLLTFSTAPAYHQQLASNPTIELLKLLHRQL